MFTLPCARLPVNTEFRGGDLTFRRNVSKSQREGDRKLTAIAVRRKPQTGHVREAREHCERKTGLSYNITNTLFLYRHQKQTPSNDIQIRNRRLTKKN
ncbi:unnamed protein product [Hermetia illucens]|nr:unnamed protein product [Hermetia illucens]